MLDGITITSKVVYTTKDGIQFENLADAINHNKDRDYLENIFRTYNMPGRPIGLLNGHFVKHNLATVDAVKNEFIQYLKRKYDSLKYYNLQISFRWLRTLDESCNQMENQIFIRLLSIDDSGREFNQPAIAVSSNMGTCGDIWEKTDAEFGKYW